MTFKVKTDTITQSGRIEIFWEFTGEILKILKSKSFIFLIVIRYWNKHLEIPCPPWELENTHLPQHIQFRKWPFEISFHFWGEKLLKWLSNWFLKILHIFWNLFSFVNHLVSILLCIWELIGLEFMIQMALPLFPELGVYRFKFASLQAMWHYFFFLIS